MFTVIPRLRRGVVRRLDDSDTSEAVEPATRRIPSLVRRSDSDDRNEVPELRRGGPGPA